MFKRVGLPAFVFLVCTSFVFMGCSGSMIDFFDQNSNSPAAPNKPTRVEGTVKKSSIKTKA